MPCAASTSTNLGKDQLLVWQGPRGATLDVLRGRVWVTASNQLDDHFVDAGQRLALPARSRVVISGECEAAISIQVPSSHPIWLVPQALTGLLRGRRAYKAGITALSAFSSPGEGVRLARPSTGRAQALTAGCVAIMQAGDAPHRLDHL